MFVKTYDWSLQLRHNILQKIISLPIGKMNQMHTGKLTTLMSEEITIFERHICFVRIQYYTAIGSLIGLLIIASLLSLYMAMSLYVVACVLFFIFKREKYATDVRLVTP